MAATESVMPRQDIPESEKTLEWYKKHTSFGEHLISQNVESNKKASKHYDSYNGKTEEQSIKHIVSKYGKHNHGKYVAYRLSKTKLDRMVGEFLEQPLNPTVRTINSKAVNAKTEKFMMHLGSYHAKDALGKLKEVGVDPLEGAEIPDMSTPETQAKISYKDMEESIMQILLKESMKQMNMMLKFSSQVLDCTIASRVWGRIMVNEITGKMDFKPIDPRDRIGMEFDRDPFYEQSPIMGSNIKTPISELLGSLKLSTEERNSLDQIRTNPTTYLGSEYRGRYSMQDGQFCADVIHVEWKGWQRYYKRKVKVSNILGEEQVDEDVDPKLYEEALKAKEKGFPTDFNTDDVETLYREQMYEGLQIGHNLWPAHYQRPKPFVMRDEDTEEVTGFSYYGMVFNKVDGEAISLKEICNNFDDIFDSVIYQALREINKNKGKVIVYDRAGMPKDTKLKEVMYRMTNDSFIDINTAASGNMGGKDLSINATFKEIDLGLSASFPYLLQFKNEIIATLDQITGINNARSGEAKTSQTVTNNMQNLQASRTVTGPMFYYLTKYFEKVLNGIVETGKLVWGIYKPNRARVLLGDEKFNFMIATSKIAYSSYVIELVNPMWERAIMERMREMANISLNAKEIRPIDVLDLELQETLADKRAMLERGWNIVSQERARQIEADIKNSIAQRQAQEKLAKDTMEDQQASELDKIRLKAIEERKTLAAKQKGDLILNQNDSDNEEFAQTGNTFA